MVKMCIKLLYETTYFTICTFMILVLVKKWYITIIRVVWLGATFNKTP